MKLSAGESPRWLMAQGLKNEAEQILAELLPNQMEVSKGIMEIEELLMIKKSRCSDLLFPSPAIKRILLAGFGVSFFQQASGVEAAVYYTPTTLRNAGITGTFELLGATVGVGFVKLLFIFVALFLMDKLGRKHLLMGGSVGLVFSLVILGIHFSVSAPSGLAIFGQCSFMAFFSIGFGPVMWVLSSEIYPLYLRGTAQSFGVAINRMMSGITALTFLSFSEAITIGGVYFFYAGTALIGLIYVYFLVPETKQKSLEEIEKFFYETYEPESKTWENSLEVN